MSKDTYRILAKDQMMNNNSEITRLNNNDIIIGPSGAGKTWGYVLPNIMQCNESMIVSDPKGVLRRKVSGVLKKQGYRIVDIDFTSCMTSPYGYNPLDYIRYDAERDCYNEQDIMSVAAALVPIECTHEPFWDMAGRMYLESMIGFVLECLPIKEHTLDSVVKMMSQLNNKSRDFLFLELSELKPDSFGAIRYNLYKNMTQASRTHSCIMGMLAEKLSPLAFDGARALFHNMKRIQLEELGKRKTAVFLTISDTDRSMDRLANVFYTQAFHVLCESADRDYKEQKLPVPVRLILDDFASNVYIEDFDKVTSMIRSRGIYTSVILQSLSQLESMYGEARAQTILNNCDNCLYLGGQDVKTARYFSTKANKSVNTILNMPLDDAYLFTRGREPRKVGKYDLRTHERYKEMTENEAIGA